MQRVERLETGRFEWDENKRLSNIRKSGLDFIDAASGLLLPHLETASDKHEEARTKAICQISDRVIVVIYTMRGEVCRIISAWPADKNEQRKYRDIFGG
jgi:uncharacterized DUF497 family protein